MAAFDGSQHRHQPAVISGGVTFHAMELLAVALRGQALGLSSSSSSSSIYLQRLPDSPHVQLAWIAGSLLSL